MKRNVFVAMLVLWLTGCAHKQQPQVVDECDLVCQDLRESAKSVAQSIKGLLEIESAGAPRAPVRMPAQIPNGLGQQIMFRWYGPIQPAVESLSKQIGYSFAVTGRVPSVPVIVHVDHDAITVFEALRDIGIQAGKRANLILDIGRRRIELAYID